MSSAARLTAVSMALLLAPTMSVLATDAAPVLYPAGASAFQANCSVCHGAKGAGQPGLAPPLTAYPARYAASAAGRRQLAITVLNGMFGRIEVQQQRFDFKMPDFGNLDDAMLAAVLNFVVFDVARAPEDTRPLTPEEIASERSHPLDGAGVREERAKLLATLGL
jgi:mono/diheme cytochrome c family protein